MNAVPNVSVSRAPQEELDLQLYYKLFVYEIQ